MKPIFCIDITKNKKSKLLNGKEFITKTTAQEAMQAMENKEEELHAIEKKTKLPACLRVLRTLCGYYALIVLMVLIRSCSDQKLSQNMGRASWIFISGIICAVAWILMVWLGKEREKDVIQEENAEEKVQLYLSHVESIYESLGVPQDATLADVLMFRYVIKKGEVAVRTVGLQAVPYLNFQARVFADETALHIADTQDVYSFAFSDLKRIQRVDKRILISSWHKASKPNSAEYKPYKLVMNDYGVLCRWYYILEGERDGEAFGIYFPSYELPVLEALTGLKAEENTPNE